MKTLITLFLILVLISPCAIAQTNVSQTSDEIELWWKTGKTLPMETAARFPLPEVRIQNDTGINVLIDMAHKCDFFLLWNLSGPLHKRGFRSIGSHATLDSLLTPGAPCRIRIPVAHKTHPFAWWPAPRFNVVVTEGAEHYPEYAKEEQDALKQFIENGGGLILSGARVKGKNWSMNTMLSQYGAQVKPGAESYDGRKWPILQVDKNWEIIKKGKDNNPIYARRSFGEGRIVLFASSGLFRFDRKNKEEKKKKCDFLAEAIHWAAKGSPPVGGDTRIPTPMAGGGGIYPESETRLDGIVCFYSKNQIPELLNTVKTDFPTITNDIYAWLPSPKPEQPMYLVLCSGGGGGWAVNAYLPKEASTISTSPEGIRSIFGHEQAHTMSGPCSSANHPFGGNRGEEHAGWFQGKINAKYNGDKGPNRKCNRVFLNNYDKSQTDPKKIFKEKNLDSWRTGHDRLMIWYVWQKLDDRYGPTWYPRWRFVQDQRWKNDPKRKLTWEESIEDMSIAVGEDLLPFFCKTGKELKRKRITKVSFLGETLKLAPAPIEPTPPGDVCLDPIGDYKQPIKIED